MHEEFDLGQSNAVATKVREELARRRRSRQWLADEARISISTLEKALSGRRPFTLGTVVRLEEALTTRLRDAPIAPAPQADSRLAPEELGAYARAGVRWLEGHYLTLRPSIDEPGAIYAYRTVISWDDSRNLLQFAESARLDSDFTQKGVVSFPGLSGHIYLVTSWEGQYRMALLCRPGIHGDMNGVLTTLVVGSGSQLIPASTPITLVPIRGDAEPQTGLVRPGMECHEEYRTRVECVTIKRYAVFPGLTVQN
ncbi:helix-turn-helix transcriptional regulator [Sphingosinicella sp. BN140058]|uniref:helix-turn-helix domain-containing protein n=1 Tax=Sphingosinicella sp. BN140058 TaxID=1892855 RepID=UPI001011A6E7|nr:helix-turn-helix transcriptional regulator [Sphingosinicella sp. BN140058]QAY75725.1 XRE family transcriptional regulator [Sphingosinicella sp. BN140058]